MKFSLFLVLILLLGIAVCPFCAAPLAKLLPATVSPQDGGIPQSLTLQRTADSRRITVSWSEYLTGVLAAEIAPDTEPEALKAQAVAAHTYALFRLQRGDTLTDDPETCQGYWSDEERRAAWGENYAQRQARLSQAADSVVNEVLLYDGAPILAAYHALSPGKTESAATVWGKKLAYLPSVAADGDLLSPQLETTLTLTQAEFLEQSAKLDGANLKRTARKWVGKATKTASGFVQKIRIGDAAFSGMQVRAAFDLPSPFFTLTQSDSTFTFVVRGRGHGVGMSQNSADFMARQGSDYKEILAHFYPGAVLAAGSEPAKSKPPVKPAVCSAP